MGKTAKCFFVVLLALYVPHRCRELMFDPDDLSTYNLSEVSMLLGVGHISDGLLSPPVFSGVDSEPVGVIWGMQSPLWPDTLNVPSTVTVMGSKHIDASLGW